MAGIGTYDVNGWTDLVATTGLAIYVSNAGNDTTGDGSIGNPYKTITKGLTQLRDGYPDWLLLKCGDVFNNVAAGGTAETNLRIDRSGGLSATEPMVITSYGTGVRPIIRNGAMWYGSSSVGLIYIAITNLDFWYSINDPAASDYSAPGDDTSTIALQLLSSGATNSPLSGATLVENCRFRFYGTQVQINGYQDDPTKRWDDVIFRRNVVVDGVEFGVQLAGLDTVLMEENILVRNGWATRTVQLHNSYMRHCSNFTCRGNFFYKGGNMSMKQSGDTAGSFNDLLVEDNTFYRGMVGFGHSDPTLNMLTEFSHINGTVQNNVISQPNKTMYDTTPPYDFDITQAIGFNLGTLYNYTFEGNIFTNNDEVLAGGEIFRFQNPASEISSDITMTDNMHNWDSSYFNANATYISYAGTVVNLTQNNNLPTGATYPDPNRDLMTYNVSLGGTADEDEFIDVLLTQEKGAWDTDYMAEAFNAYIRAGFTGAPAGPTYYAISAGGQTYIFQTGS